MVIDIVNGLSIPRYLVYDIVNYRGESYMHRPFFPDRLGCVKENVIGKSGHNDMKCVQIPSIFKQTNELHFLALGPRYAAMKKGIINKQREPFSVRDKSFWGVEQARALLGPKFAASLSHEPDGLIFQPSQEVSLN